MITELQLPSDRFIDTTYSGLKQKNFIYGKTEQENQQSLKQYLTHFTILMMYEFFKDLILWWKIQY